MFSYKYPALLDSMPGYWVCDITERVLHAVSMMMYEAYDSYRLWYLPPESIMFSKILAFGMARIFGAA